MYTLFRSRNVYTWMKPSLSDTRGAFRTQIQTSMTDFTAHSNWYKYRTVDEY